MRQFLAGGCAVALVIAACGRSPSGSKAVSAPPVAQHQRGLPAGLGSNSSEGGLARLLRGWPRWRRTLDGRRSGVRGQLQG